QAEEARADSERADQRDERGETRREREEARAVSLVAASGRATLVRRLRIGRARKGRDVVALLRHGDEARRAVSRDEQRLGARAEHAVAALELRAVDGQVGLVDQLVRVGRVLREARDA